MGALASSTVLPASPAANGLVDLVRVDPGLGGENQGLGDGGDVEVDDDLVGQLGNAAAAAGAHQQGGGSHQLEIGLHALKVFGLAADHEGQGTVDGLGLAAADRGIHEIHLEGGQVFGEGLGIDRGDRTHIHHQAAGMEGAGYPAWPKQHVPNDGAIGQHGEDEVAGRANLCRSSDGGPGVLKFDGDGRVDVVDGQVAAGLQRRVAMGRPMIPNPINPILSFTMCQPFEFKKFWAGGWSGL